MRREHNVNVDMRIGVHTGFILSGIIGNKRWQYDIWSKDVTIANHMESAGVAGAVHITRQTKDHLADAFRWTQTLKDLSSVDRLRHKMEDRGAIQLQCRVSESFSESFSELQLN